MKELELIKQALNSKESLTAEALSKDNTALIVIDMVNGFAKSGNLYSDRIENIIPEVVETTKAFNHYTKLFIADTHEEHATEFEAYLPHCVGEEANVIEELKALYDERSVEIPKNSTNGFLAPAFQEWFEKNKNTYNQFVLIGDCTDICILQMALALKTYYNQHNLTSRVIVPLNAVETYHLDLNNHYGDLMNLFALYNMELNGIELVKSII